MRTLLALFSFGIFSVSTSCVSAYIQSVGGESSQVLERTYVTDFNTAWQSILDALKNSQLDVTNREGGFIQTKWTDNTAERNLSATFGNTDAFLKAQYRFHVSVAKGYYNGQASIKVSVQKEQLVQRDVLEGWTPLPTDTVDEKTLLYRIGRIVSTKMKIAKDQQEKEKKEIEAAGF